MSNITVEIKNIEEVRDYFNKRPVKVVKELNTALTRSAIIIQRMARQESPTDLGRLRNSIAIENRMGFTTAISPKANYAAAVHEGSRPHWPPLSSLEGWARRHGFASAYPLARAIAKRGTKPNRYMDRTADQGQGDVQREFDKAVDRILED